LGDALTLAREALADQPGGNSHILLLPSVLDSDARQQLSDHATALGSQLSILGIGTRSGAPVPLAEGGCLPDARGRLLLPRLNSQQLASLARQQGARYHDITAGNRDLKSVLQPLQTARTSMTSERRL